MKYYKYKIVVLNSGLASQVTAELRSEEGVENYVAKNRFDDFSYFSVSDEKASEFIAAQMSELNIAEINESEYNEGIKNTYTYERLNELLADDKAAKMAEIKEKFEANITHSLISIDGVGVIDGGERYLQNIQNIYENLKEKGENSINFRLANNSFVEVDLEQLELMRKTIIETGLGYYQKKWELEDAVTKAVSADEVANVVVKY